MDSQLHPPTLRRERRTRVHSVGVVFSSRAMIWRCPSQHLSCWLKNRISFQEATKSCAAWTSWKSCAFVKSEQALLVLTSTSSLIELFASTPHFLQCSSGTMDNGEVSTRHMLDKEGSRASIDRGRYPPSNEPKLVLEPTLCATTTTPASWRRRQREHS